MRKKLLLRCYHGGRRPCRNHLPAKSPVSRFLRRSVRSQKEPRCAGKFPQFMVGCALKPTFVPVLLSAGCLLGAAAEVSNASQSGVLHNTVGQPDGRCGGGVTFVRSSAEIPRHHGRKREVHVGRASTVDCQIAVDTGHKHSRSTAPLVVEDGAAILISPSTYPSRSRAAGTRRRRDDGRHQ